MEPIIWPTLTQHVRGWRIEGLAYDVENGLLRAELDGGTVLLVSAYWGGCQGVLDAAGKRREAVASSGCAHDTKATGESAEEVEL